MNQTQIGSFEHIPLAAIRPSTTNPRKHFDQAALDELTGSIRAMGVTQPIHVRSLVGEEWPQPGSDRDQPAKYEIVTGERRFRASTAAELHEIPAFVHDGLSDEDAMELQLVENLQRADLHPTEEADGYRALMAHGETAEDVAKKAGKTLGYVQQRLKLLTLEVDAKELFAAGHLTLGHALLLARLTPADQEKALRYLLSLTGDYQRTEIGTAIRQRIKLHKDYTPNSRLTDRTEAQLKEWVTSNVLLLLKTAPWDLGDAELLPIAGPCTTCPKRTGANQALFADITTNEDTCVDGACYSDKLKAFTLRQQTIAKEQGTPLLKISAKESTERLEKPAVEMRGAGVKLQGGKAVDTKKPVVVATKAVKKGQWVASRRGGCPMSVQAIETDGPDQGKVRWVCADQSCKVHPRHVSSPRPAERVDHNMNSEANRAKREDEEKIQAKVNEAIGAQMLKVDAQHEGAIENLILFVVEYTEWAGEIPDLCLMLDIPVPGYKADDAKDWQKRNKASEKAKPLFRKFVDEATLPELHDAARAILVLHAQESYDERDMPLIAEMFGVDAKATAKTVRAKLEAEAKAAAPAAAKPAKKATAKKKKAGK